MISQTEQQREAIYIYLITSIYNINIYIYTHKKPICLVSLLSLFDYILFAYLFLDNKNIIFI